MVGRTRRALGATVALVLVLTACTGSNSNDDSTTIAATGSSDATDTSNAENIDPATGATPTTIPRGSTTIYTIDPDSGEVIESEVELPGPSTYGEVVDFGIEAGIWNEVDGLTQVLGYAVGATPAADVPGVEDIHTGELDEILHRVHSIATSGEYAENELVDLQQWFDLAVPSAGALESLAATAASPQALGDLQTGIETSTHPNTVYSERGIGGGPSHAVRASHSLQAQGGCIPMDPDEFSDWAQVEGCYEMYEDVVEGVTLRVLYPSWYSLDDELAKLPLLTREALSASVSTYRDLGNIGDMTAVFSLVETDSQKASVHAFVAADAQSDTVSIDSACPITIMPVPTVNDEQFKQVIAHEAWHCVQYYSGYPSESVAGTAWFDEGGANYISNVVYPSANLEYEFLTKFDHDSMTKPLFAMSYEAWIWWQYVANIESPQAVADLLLKMINANDGGITAMADYGPQFQQFTVAFAAGEIVDASGAKISQAREALKFRSVGKDDAGRVLKMEVQPFVAARFIVDYDKQLRVTESDQTSSHGELAMVELQKRSDLKEWKQVFPEIRTKCEKKSSYMLAVTTDIGTHTAKVQVDTAEEASCDPCVLGTWDLDLESFETMIIATAQANGASTPPGGSFEFTGHYYVSLEDLGVMKQQRDGLVMTMSSEQGEIDFTIDSFAEGEYTADGKVMTVFNTTELFSEVTTSVYGLGDLNFGQGTSALDDASGDYQCNADEMTVNLTGVEPVRFDRVDKILSPPTTIAP